MTFSITGFNLQGISEGNSLWRWEQIHTQHIYNSIFLLFSSKVLTVFTVQLHAFTLLMLQTLHLGVVFQELPRSARGESANLIDLPHWRCFGRWKRGNIKKGGGSKIHDAQTLILTGSIVLSPINYAFRKLTLLKDKELWVESTKEASTTAISEKNCSHKTTSRHAAQLLQRYHAVSRGHELRLQLHDHSFIQKDILKLTWACTYKIFKIQMTVRWKKDAERNAAMEHPAAAYLWYIVVL